MIFGSTVQIIQYSVDLWGCSASSAPYNALDRRCKQMDDENLKSAGPDFHYGYPYGPQVQENIAHLCFSAYVPTCTTPWLSWKVICFQREWRISDRPEGDCPHSQTRGYSVLGAPRIQRFITLSTMFLSQFHPPLSISLRSIYLDVFQVANFLQDSPTKFHVHLPPN
jgi:hypothetical protein